MRPYEDYKPNVAEYPDYPNPICKNDMPYDPLRLEKSFDIEILTNN